VAATATYAYGQLFYFTKTYNSVTATIGTWYGVPVDGGKDDVGHTEMLRPTYFFFFGFVPLAASVLFLELLKHFNVRRITSHFVLRFTRVLRGNRVFSVG
jgi:ferric-chelate reductase